MKTRKCRLCGEPVRTATGKLCYAHLKKAQIERTRKGWRTRRLMAIARARA